MQRVYGVYHNDAHANNFLVYDLSVARKLFLQSQALHTRASAMIFDMKIYLNDFGRAQADDYNPDAKNVMYNATDLFGDFGIPRQSTLGMQSAHLWHPQRLVVPTVSELRMFFLHQMIRLDAERAASDRAKLMIDAHVITEPEMQRLRIANETLIAEMAELKKRNDNLARQLQIKEQQPAGLDCQRQPKDQRVAAASTSCSLM